MSLSPTTDPGIRRPSGWPRSLALCAAIALHGVVQAASLTVMPVVVDLSARHTREALTITNQGDQTVTAQAEVVAWHQTESKDQFETTSDILLNPAIFTIAPGQKQILRLGWRGASAPSSEKTYRIFLREIPAQTPRPVGADGVAAALTVLLELRIPVYVAPANIVRLTRWQTHRRDDTGIEVRLENLGSVHTVVRDIQMKSAVGDHLGTPLGIHAAVLAGQARAWTIAAPSPRSGALVLEVQTDTGLQRLMVEP